MPNKIIYTNLDLDGVLRSVVLGCVGDELNTGYRYTEEALMAIANRWNAEQVSP